MADELIAGGCYKTFFKSDLEITNPVSTAYEKENQITKWLVLEKNTAALIQNKALAADRVSSLVGHCN